MNGMSSSPNIKSNNIEKKTYIYGFDLTSHPLNQEYNGYSVDKIRNKIAEYAPVVVTTDTSNFTDTELRVLDLIIDAAKFMDPIFNRQVFRWYDETRENLAR